MTKEFTKLMSDKLKSHVTTYDERDGDFETLQ